MVSQLVVVMSRDVVQTVKHLISTLGNCRTVLDEAPDLVPIVIVLAHFCTRPVRKSLPSPEH